MANHLHWYLNGTPGLQDGTEIDITNPLEFITNTYKVLFSNAKTNNISQRGSYPILFIPLSLRCETGFEIASGNLEIGYTNSNNCFINAISKSGSSYTPSIMSFTDTNSMNNALQATVLYLNSYNRNSMLHKSLIITEENKITDVNRTVILCVINHGEIPQGANNAFDLINFTFTETAVTA